MYCVVQKPFDGKNRSYCRGRVINTSKWNPIRRDQMIAQRFVRQASPDEVDKARAAKNTIAARARQKKVKRVATVA